MKTKINYFTHVYKYNSLQQLIEQTSPDGGTRVFFYDAIGRLIVSQNEKQRGYSPVPSYSYTLYDELSRITEAGEIDNGTLFSDAIARDKANMSFTQWMTGGLRNEITCTFYDEPDANIALQFGPEGQQNLRSRVSFVTYDDDDNAANNYNHAAYYSYDIHGNVKTLVQDNPSLASLSQQYKKTEYRYDLVSGNVNEVHYQAGKQDAMSHRYLYDADNRITQVFTSQHPSPFGEIGIWDKESKYFYYLHGPLARTELGDQQVQGTDYAYTIHGWIKGVNSDVLLAKNDIGKDADLAAGNLNKFFARDAFGYSLGYFEGDYLSIANIPPTDNFTASIAGSALKTDRNDLFNGNISHMVTTLTNPVTNTTIAQSTAYKYDQLNRIKRMRAHRNLDYAQNLWPSTNGDDGSYAEDYTYNANGSILSLKRNGLASVSSGQMDDLTYTYETVTNGYAKNTNKLRQIQDAVASNTYTDDMDGQVQNNYVYDEIGNLISDQFECIQNIEWTVYGKVKKVTRTPGCTTEGTPMPDLEFHYDASGNMIEKIVKPAAGINNTDSWTHTYYVRDASGNIMATYEKTIQSDPSCGTFTHFVLTEHQVYGSSHIGTNKKEKVLVSCAVPVTEPNVYNRTLGKKQYFLTDHRGNNNVTVSDRKIAIEDLQNPGTIAYFEGDILRAVDYYPFGREMNGRIFNKNESEFGYNGKQNIKEWSSRLGGPQNYGARIYMPSCGCFVSPDPIIIEEQKYPWYSPYQFAGNKPIWAIDLDGKEEFTRTDYYNGGNLYKTEIKMVSSKDANLGIQVVHHTNVTANNDGTFTKTYIGSTFGSTRGTNAFFTPSSTPGPNEAAIANTIRQSALKVDNLGNPIVGQLVTPKNVTISSINPTTGVVTTNTVTATQAYLVPGAGETMQVGYSLMLLDATGNPIGLEITGGGVAAAGSIARSDLTVYNGGMASTEFTLNATSTPAAYTGTAPANDISNVNAVPKNAVSRGRFVSAVDRIQRFFGTNFKSAQGGSGTVINP